MNIKIKIFKWIAIIVSLLLFQTMTYFFIGQNLIKNKLLPDYFYTLTHHSDSLFVRDFYTAECRVGDARTYLPINLRHDEKDLKQKFNISFVYFDSEENFSWNDSTEKQYNLVYETWTSRPDWITLFGGFSSRQTELLQTDKKYFYKREVTYHWIFFFWVKTFEWFESGDMKRQ